MSKKSISLNHNVSGKVFELNHSFLDEFRNKAPEFGFNGLGEFVYYRTYSRVKENGKNETPFDTFKRVVEGCYEIQRRWCLKEDITWSRAKAQASAQEMFRRMWDFKFLPPGRGLWAMGTQFVYERGSAALNNCAYVSTNDIAKEFTEPFCFMLDMSMLGVGVGFDTKGAGKVSIMPLADGFETSIIPDSREGWVDSVRDLLHTYINGSPRLEFDYSEIRPEGTPIKGFGGVASGPGVLKRLHEMIRELLDSKVASGNLVISSVDITDLMNFIGVCVVAGNVRRSSEIAIGEFDDQDYIEMKDYNKFPKEAVSHRWASNNSVFAEVGMNYEKIAKQIALNGEPGLIWLDNIRNYGRFADGLQKGIDKRVMGTNPCFAGSMRLLTTDGYATLKELWEKAGQQWHNKNTNFVFPSGKKVDVLDHYGSIDIINSNGVVKATSVYKTSNSSDVYRVCFKDGSFIDATDYHQFIVLERKKIKKKVKYVKVRKYLKDLKPGDLIPNNELPQFGEYNNPDYAELAGWCIGDGSLSPKADGQVRANCNCYDSDILDVMPKLQKLMHRLYKANNKSSNQNPAYAGWDREQEHFDHNEQIIGSNVLGRMLKDDGVVNGDKHRVPNNIWNGDQETIAAFIRGLASADGFVNLGNRGQISVRISQSNEELLLQVKLLLNQFGINSTVELRKKADKSLLNDGKGGKKLYDSKTKYELIVSGIKQSKLFLDKIGFIQNWKTEPAEVWLQHHEGSNNSNTGRYTFVEKIEHIGKQEVYCLTEPESNEVVVNGHLVGQCAEQSLESYELCCLCETFPARHESAEDYHRTLKYAYLYAKTVTLVPTHNQKTNSVMLRNRRIGLSQSGIAQAFEKFGYRKVLEEFCNKGYGVVSHWDEIYSDWLCVRKSIKKTSVKPSGSVSLLCGSTPGIHYTVAPSRSYWRRVRLAKTSPLVNILTDANYHVEDSVTDPNTVVVKFGVSQPQIKTVGEMTIFEQSAIAVALGEYWADNQVSVTIQFKKEEAGQISEVLKLFEDKLKSISFLPLEDHGYAQAPYEAATEQEVTDYLATLTKLDFSALCADGEGSRFCDGDSCTLN